jgi:uncharacterized cofD-like protein
MSKMKKIVVMGGGTGTYTVLRGLKKYPVNLSAIVAMTDDGGSSGILRDELGVLPPGDIRQCLVALSESSETMRELFCYRFTKGGLKGHNLGNLLISALEKMEGGFDQALEKLHQILALQGKVIPVTLNKAKLLAELENGKILFGEHEITECKLLKKHPLKRIFLQPKAKINPRAFLAIKEADMVIIGPGNFYSSLIPLFLVDGVAKALKQTKARILYNVNLMTKRGQADNFSVFDFVQKIENYLEESTIDIILFNTEKPNQNLLKKYSNEGELVEIPLKKNFKRDGKIFIGKNLLSREIHKQEKGDSLKRTLIRHDSDKLAKEIMKIITLG